MPLADERTKEIIARHGGPKQIHKDLKAFDKLVQQFEEKRDELMKTVPDHWIAIVDGRKPYVAKTLNQVEKEIRKDGIRPKQAYFKFLSSKPQNQIL